MRQGNWYFRFLLILQCLISSNICVLNATLTAGSDHAVDILLNSVALLALNDAVEIMGRFFLMQLDEEIDDPMGEEVVYRDRVFARWLAFPHFIVVILYGLLFLGVFGAEKPLNGFTFAVYVQPYSIFGFPLFCVPWYCICYLDVFEKIRCAFCFE